MCAGIVGQLCIQSLILKLEFLKKYKEYKIRSFLLLMPVSNRTVPLEGKLPEFKLPTKSKDSQGACGIYRTSGCLKWLLRC